MKPPTPHTDISDIPWCLEAYCHISGLNMNALARGDASARSQQLWIIIMGADRSSASGSVRSTPPPWPISKYILKGAGIPRAYRHGARVALPVLYANASEVAPPTQDGLGTKLTPINRTVQAPSPCRCVGFNARCRLNADCDLDLAQQCGQLAQ
jgi:hypothetical protein